MPLPGRMSGGGTIYTDFGAWQYSFITFAKGKASGMRELAAPVVDILRKLGAPAEFSGRNDILIEGRKVSGTAQYRKNGCVVHHGSLLYAADLDEIVRSTNVSCEKLQAKGIQSVRQRVGNISDYLPAPLSMMEFKEALIKSFAADPSQIMTLEKTDIRRVRELAKRFSLIGNSFMAATLSLTWNELPGRRAVSQPSGCRWKREGSQSCISLVTFWKTPTFRGWRSC